MIFLPLEEIASIPIPSPDCGTNYHLLSELTIIDKTRIKTPSGDVFDIKDLLKRQIEIREIDGILSTFANAELLNFDFKLEPGIIKAINPNDPEYNKYLIPKSYKFFAVRFSAMVMGRELEHYIPFFENCDGTLLFTRASHPTSPKDFIGDGCFIAAYFHKPHNEAWKEVLYKSLYELSRARGNYNTSLILLFSAIDILTKNILKSFGIYNPKKHSRVICRLLEMNKILENQNLIDKSSFKKLVRNFDEKVTKPRNNFEHEHELVSGKAIIEAYSSAFDIIWYLDQIKTS